MKIGIIQQSNEENSTQNISKITEKIKQLSKEGANLIVLQELQNSLYFCQTEDPKNFDMAEEIPGKSTELYGILARSYGIVIVITIFEKRAPGIYHNTALVIEKNGKIAGKYRKMHIPDDPAYYEKFYFTPGDLDFCPINTSVGKLGVLICWDQWYPEAARLMALAGAEILIFPTAIGWELTDSEEEKQRQIDAWTTIQRGHAIANGLPVISCNRVGYEKDPSGKGGGIQFWGGSFATGAQGEFLWQGSTEEEETTVVEIDLSQSEKVRRIWPFFRDRRIENYQDLLKRWGK